MQGKLFPVTLMLFLGLSACSSFNRKNEKPLTPPEVAATTPVVASASLSKDQIAKDEVKLTAPQLKKGQIGTKADPNFNLKLKLTNKQGKVIEAPQEATSKGGKEMTKVEVSSDKTEPSSTSEATTPSEQATKQVNSRRAGPITAERALGWLKNGNNRFIKGNLRNDGANTKDRLRLTAGQAPHTVVLSCSDSRVPPEIIFDQKLGEIFVVRVAGEALDSSSIGSIEYAVEHLGANHVLIMGHESCGAVKAAIGTLDGSGLGSPALNSLVADLRPRLQSFKGMTSSKGFLEESWANVDGVSHDLLERSEIVRDAVASGEVKVTRAIYHLDSGKVEWR